MVRRKKTSGKSRAGKVREAAASKEGFSAAAVSPSDHDRQVRMSLLGSALAAAVPFWVLQIKDMPFDERQRRSSELANIVAEKGDIILFRSSKHGETAKAFNALAEGVAHLSFSPGGVKTFGQHFDANQILKQFGLRGDAA